MFSAGTSRRRPFRISATLQPSSLGNQLQCGIAPLHVKGGGKSVKEVAVENPLSNPLSRGGHTQIAGFGAFSKNGGTHTVPLRGAHVKNLNSHLKSLRNKRKERQKEQR